MAVRASDTVHPVMHVRGALGWLRTCGPRFPRRLALALALLLGGACGPPAPPTPTAGSAPTRPATASPVPGPRIAPPSPAAAPSLAASPTAESGQPAYEISESDSGRSFSYPVTSRFTLILDERTHPRAELRLACMPDEVLGPISNVPPVAAPRYAVRYEGLRPGTCTVTDRDFVATIQITG